MPGTADNKTGYAKVHLHNVRESTHALTALIRRAALLLGRAGWPEYFEDAECILRGHLLPSQVIDVDDLPDEPDAADGCLWGRSALPISQENLL